MQTQDIQPQEFFLKPGFVLAHHETVLVRCVLGSCVAVTMFDRRQSFGGVNHFIWPRIEEGGKPSVVYGNVAITTLCRVLEDMGASRADMEAQIFGGGCPPEAFGHREQTLGAENLDLARSILARMEIPVVSEDVGGCKGRKLVYNTASNEAMVIKVDHVRATDWYEHGQDIDWDRA